MEPITRALPASLFHLLTQAGYDCRLAFERVDGRPTTTTDVEAIEALLVGYETDAGDAIETVERIGRAIFVDGDTGHACGSDEINNVVIALAAKGYHADHFRARIAREEQRLGLPAGGYVVDRAGGADVTIYRLFEDAPILVTEDECASVLRALSELSPGATVEDVWSAICRHTTH